MVRHMPINVIMFPIPNNLLGSIVCYFVQKSKSLVDYVIHWKQFEINIVQNHVFHDIRTPDWFLGTSLIILVPI